ncbi:MAG TPA: nuclear transport factor 2 family protein [Gemmatimonadaceae bacterium]
MRKEHEMLARAYDAFNARDIDGALAVMHPDVEWANGMDGGYVHGHDEVRAYWSRQWTMIDPHVTPVGFEDEGGGRTVVHVHQVVRDVRGNPLVDSMIDHVYTIEGGLVRRMCIRHPGDHEPE